MKLSAFSLSVLPLLFELTLIRKCVRVATADNVLLLKKDDKNSFCKGVRIRENVEITVENSAC